MSTADLLAAVLHNPQDDAPRLAYADAIASADRARAVFIRTQIALARQRTLSPSVRRDLRRRARSLSHRHGKRWLAECPVLPGVTWLERFARGFPDFCSVPDAATFRRQSATIFAAAPVERLYIHRIAPRDLPDVLRMPELARLRGLSLHGAALRTEGLGDPEAVLLADCPHLARLRSLSLHSNKIGDAGARALSDSPYLGRLRSLDLTQNRIGAEGLRALAHSTSLASLIGLELYLNKDSDGSLLNDAALIELIGSPLAHRLRRLNIGGSSATLATAQAIAASPALRRLRSLDLNNSSIGDAGLMVLAHSPFLKRLRSLYLRRTNIGDAGLAVLLRSPLARRLRLLNIEAADITALVGWDTVRSPALERIRKLEMWDCDNLHTPVCNALKLRFGKRVTVHAAERPRRPRRRPDAATRAAFLADIRARPEDDSPRLIYADWLDDHGEPERAEFIRVQCQLARLGENDHRRVAIQHREGELLERHRVSWTEGAFLDWLRHPQSECPDPYSHEVCKVMARAVEARLRSETSTDPAEKERCRARIERCGHLLQKHRLLEHQADLPLFQDCHFERGFPDQVTVPDLMLLDFAGAVRDLGMVRYLATGGDDEDAETPLLLDRIIACFDAPRLQSLVVQAQVDKLAKFEMFAAWPGAAELRRLEFRFVWELPGDEVLRALARSPYLRNLTHLHLYLCEGFTEEGVEALLAHSTDLPSLKTVYLGEDENEVPEAAVRLLRQRFPDSGHHDD
jgi:uncharacterized protein (TIGR02996 family)